MGIGPSVESVEEVLGVGRVAWLARERRWDSGCLPYMLPVQECDWGLDQALVERNHLLGKGAVRKAPDSGYTG